ncbi:hypothetical protein [Saccharospirillum mangrovi]|uniref:hypothetical protein n=1 Tax=Saccharospirillum mangrovi TaxID=2161747 RepID=UPI000D39BEB6|nr:hypothetical protein [Saccharospirillum mangrovi]
MQPEKLEIYLKGEVMNENRSQELCSVVYIWIDSSQFVTRINSKTRYLVIPDQPQLSHFPSWTFDGRFALQSPCDEAYLTPVRWYRNPLKLGRHFLLLCETTDAEGYAQPSNHRAGLKQMIQRYEAGNQLWMGFEQSYCLYGPHCQESLLLQSQGETSVAYRCGDGVQVTIRDIVEQHALACLDAGLPLASWHACATSKQWLFQLGYRGLDENYGALRMADDLWLARYLLERVAERVGCVVCYDAEGDQSPLATGISTWKTRNPRFGMDEIQHLVSVLEELESIDRTSQEFKHQFYRSEDYAAGYTSRQSAIRIPLQVVQQRCGYLVDRRPRGNADPYRIAQYLLGALSVGEDDSQSELTDREDSESGEYVDLVLNG